MRRSLLSLAPLVCPGCRHADRRGLHVSTLVAEGDAEEIEDGVLRCQGCGRGYAVIDGIPLLVPPERLDGFLAAGLLGLVERDLDPRVTALLVGASAEDGALAALTDHLSVYLESQWGDRARPALPAPPPLPTRLAGRPPVELAVELGAGCGRGLAELAPSAGVVVGIDLHFGALRRARRLLRGEEVTYLRREGARTYSPVTTRGERRDNVLLVCADVLDPPLLPDRWQRVVGLNVLDSVRSARDLLRVMDGLCARGGEIVSCSPYTWRAGVADLEGRLDTADPAADLRRRLEQAVELARPYRVEEEEEIPWCLRAERRLSHLYTTHWIRARKA